jgi:hypothetical protein
MQQAIQSGKLESGYVIPEPFRSNTPQILEQRLATYRRQGFFGEFPLGTDFTPEELVLAKTLRRVKSRAASSSKPLLAAKALLFRNPPASTRPYLERLKLTAPQDIQDKVLRMLLVEELARQKL